MSRIGLVIRPLPDPKPCWWFVCVFVCLFVWLVGWGINVSFQHKNRLYCEQGGDLVPPG